MLALPLCVPRHPAFEAHFDPPEDRAGNQRDQVIERSHGEVKQQIVLGMRRGFLAVLAEYLHRRFDNVFQHGAMGPTG